MSEPHRSLGSAEAPEVVRLHLGGDPIWLVVSTEIERKYRARASKKEPWTIAWLESRVGRGEVLYDIGANVGVFSLVGAIHRGAHVIAFEPGYASFARLCENIRLNRCDHRVVPMPWLLSERRELRDFAYRSTEPGQSRHISRERRATLGSPTDEYRQPICAIPLDELVDMFSLPAPTHIKLDVDGAEREVLRGAARTLRDPALRSILIEADAETGPDVEAQLTAAGLHLESRHVREQKPNAPWYGVFVRQPS